MFLVYVKSSVLSKNFASTQLAPCTSSFSFSPSQRNHTQVRALLGFTAFSVFLVRYASWYCWGLWNLIFSFHPFWPLLDFCVFDSDLCPPLLCSSFPPFAWCFVFIKVVGVQSQLFKIL
jgi:hypothetical protein